MRSADISASVKELVLAYVKEMDWKRRGHFEHKQYYKTVGKLSYRPTQNCYTVNLIF